MTEFRFGEIRAKIRLGTSSTLYSVLDSTPTYSSLHIFYSLLCTRLYSTHLFSLLYTLLQPTLLYTSFTLYSILYSTPTYSTLHIFYSLLYTLLYSNLLYSTHLLLLTLYSTLLKPTLQLNYQEPRGSLAISGKYWISLVVIFRSLGYLRLK